MIAGKARSKYIVPSTLVYTLQRVAPSPLRGTSTPLSVPYTRWIGGEVRRMKYSVPGAVCLTNKEASDQTGKDNCTRCGLRSLRGLRGLGSARDLSRLS